jgi:hypothetical protein
MAKSEAKVEELVVMIERGELRLPEMQRRPVYPRWRFVPGRQRLSTVSVGAAQIDCGTVESVS